ncbi:MAG: HDOD domain-containing protein [Rhodocyclales bacterium GT-UBC]|nr:MAG: HDOD domain-containing protein [Rhodocyclales bacterium GT-UBC]
MSVSDLLFLHPLLGADDSWSGYLVETPPDTDCDKAIERLVHHAKLREFDRRHTWLIPATPGLESKDAIGNLVQVFPAQASESLKALETSLRQSGHKVALQTTPEEKLPMPGAWDLALINTSHARALRPFALIGLSSRTIVLSTDVQSYADYAWVHANACTLSTTEFLLGRNLNGQKADMTRVKLLEMLALIAEDAETEAIENVFRQEPKLSYSLLRLVNSAAIAPRSPITSFAQAINLLGRRQLQRWLQLLVYADTNNGHQPNPLLQKAAARGRLLELLVGQLSPPPQVDNKEDAAFMVGVFSLLDVLLNMSMSEILQQLPLATTVRDALADYAGSLGALLRVIDAAERRNLGVANELLGKTSVSPAAYVEAQLSALHWAARIHCAA